MLNNHYDFFTINLKLIEIENLKFLKIFLRCSIDLLNKQPEIFNLTKSYIHQKTLGSCLCRSNNESLTLKKVFFEALPTNTNYDEAIRVHFFRIFLEMLKFR